MSEPCSEKNNIDRLFEFHEEKLKKLNDMEVRQVQIHSDITHIKSLVDNGLSKQIYDIHANFLELKPVIQHHSTIVKRIEDVGWMISYGLLMGLIGLLVWGIGKGFVPK